MIQPQVFSLRPATLPPYRLYPQAFSLPECRTIIKLASSPESRNGEGYERYQDAVIDPAEAPWLTFKLSKLVLAANKAYKFNLIGLTDEVLLNTYKRGEYKGWHHDSNHDPNKLSLIAMLSNGFTGGEFQFLGGPKMNLKQGSVIIFPSFASHQVCRVRTGRRITLATWAVGPRWR